MQSEPLVVSANTRVGEVSLPPIFSAVPATRLLSWARNDLHFHWPWNLGDLSLSPRFCHLVAYELGLVDTKQYLPHCFSKD